MIVYRRSEERGHADKGWQDSFHTFSFADYKDPKHSGFRSLRVLNEDRVAPAKGFGAQGHRDMEIISYVVSGKLGHKDSMGHEEVLGANEIQVMSAGTGVVHSEFNASPTEPVHFLQIWIEPSRKGFSSNYQQPAFEAAEKSGVWRVLATPEGGSGIARLQQDASVATTELKEGEDRSYILQPKPSCLDSGCHRCSPAERRVSKSRRRGRYQRRTRDHVDRHGCECERSSAL